VVIIICLTKQTRHVNRSIWVWWLDPACGYQASASYVYVSQISCQTKGYPYCLFPKIHEGLVGWVSAQEPSFSLRKSICTTDRCVVQFCCQLLFWRGKTKAGKTRIALGFTSLQGGGGVWIFGFHNYKQINKKCIGYPLSIFNKKLCSQTKCHIDTGGHRKKSNVPWYVSAYVRVFQFVCVYMRV